MAHRSFVPLLSGGSESLFPSTLGSQCSHYPWSSSLGRLAGHTVMEQGSFLSHSPPQPHPASSLEVSIVVLPKRLQDDGDNCHEGFHNAELQCGLHRGETRCPMGSRTSHPSAPGTHTEEGAGLWGEI